MAFPEYKTKGWWIFKEKVTVGWQDLGLVKERFSRNSWDSVITKVECHKICGSRLHVGKENGELFQYCRMCMVKIST